MSIYSTIMIALLSLTAAIPITDMIVNDELNVFLGLFLTIPIGLCIGMLLNAVEEAGKDD